MESIVNQLREVLIEGCEIVINSPNTVLNIKNSENDGSIKLAKVDILNNDNSFFAFTLDKKEFRNKVDYSFINISWINKRTDGIIYKYHNGKHNFIIIEIKSSQPSGCENQFKSMDAFINYLIRAIELNNTNIELKNNTKIAKVLITGRSPQKRPMRNIPEVPYNEKINANEIQYKKDEKIPINLNQLLDCKFNPL